MKEFYGMALTKVQKEVLQAMMDGKIVTIQEPIEEYMLEGKLKEGTYFQTSVVSEILTEFIENILIDRDILTEEEKSKITEQIIKHIPRKINDCYKRLKKGSKFVYDSEDDSWNNEEIEHSFGLILNDNFKEKFLEGVKKKKS